MEETGFKFIKQNVFGTYDVLIDLNSIDPEDFSNLNTTKLNQVYEFVKEHKMNSLVVKGVMGLFRENEKDFVCAFNNTFNTYTLELFDSSLCKYSPDLMNGIHKLIKELTDQLFDYDLDKKEPLRSRNVFLSNNSILVDYKFINNNDSIQKILF